MKSGAYLRAAGGAAMLAALALGGCATEAYVDNAVAGVQSQVAANTARLDEHDRRLTRLDGQVAASQARADAAYALASGKFNTEKLGEETIHFDTGKFRLTDAHKGQLSVLAERLKTEAKDVYLEIEGFTDAQGGEQSNRILSVRRAYAVYDFLHQQGIGLNRMEIIGLGEEYPAAENDTSTGRGQNRRVVITVVG